MNLRPSSFLAISLLILGLMASAPVAPTETGRVFRITTHPIR
jgi:hypothetical protein